MRGFWNLLGISIEELVDINDYYVFSGIREFDNVLRVQERKREER
jgi:hypothetical protein